MIARLIIQTVLWIAVMGALLFVPAGTPDWPGAWIFLAEIGAAGLAMGLWLARHDPALLEARMSPWIQRGQQGWDKVLMSIFILLCCGWLALMGLDAARYRWSSVPAWLQAIGALTIALSFYLVFLTFRENSYAAPVVRIQAERGQKVVTTGPYRYVRHPMYAGVIPLLLGVPVLLGSWYGLAVAPLLIGLLAGRAVMEERTLAAGLEGYAAYAARVRYRLIPGVW